MSNQTAIAWTDHTFNPWWGCTKIDPGCAHCYADTLASRYGHDIWGPNKPRRAFGEKHWNEPLKWNRESERHADGDNSFESPVRGLYARHLVFSGSMCDWAEDHPTADAERPKLWDLIRRTPHLDWQLLTKRADRIGQCLPADWGSGYPNVWLGVSVSEQKGIWRADHLRRIPAAVHFISYEPALGPLDGLRLDHIDWIIFGGESGPAYRAPAGWQTWARGMRKICDDLGIAFFFKQSPAHRTEMGTTLDGQTIREFPISQGWASSIDIRPSSTDGRPFKAVPAPSQR
jgi:protein gp37